MNRVRQVAIEWHDVDRNLLATYRVVKELHRSGFRIIHFEPNYNFPFKAGVANVFTLTLKKGGSCLESR